MGIVFGRQAVVRAMAAIGVVGVTAGVVAVAMAGSASARDATLTLNYTCPFPLIGNQNLVVTINATLPDNVVQNQPTPPITFTAAVTVPPTATQGLNLVGATSVSGIATASTTLADGSLTLPLSLPLTVPPTPVPASGPFTVDSTGTAPAVSFPNAGTASITVGDFSTTLTPVNAQGQPTGLGTFTSNCTQVAGQNNILATFPVTSPPPPTTTTTAPPTTTTTAPPTTTTTAPPPTTTTAPPTTTTTAPPTTTTTAPPTTTTTSPPTTTTAPTATTAPPTTTTTAPPTTTTSPPTTTTTSPPTTTTTTTTTEQPTTTTTPATITFSTEPLSTTTENLGGGSTGSGTGTPSTLAFTGVNVLGPALAGLVLIGAGIGIVLLQRRHRGRKT